MKISDVRKDVVSRLYDVSTFKWKPSAKFYEVSNKYLSHVDDEGCSCYYPDFYYYGLPYVSVGSKGSLEHFMEFIEGDVLNVSSDFMKIPGMDCLTPSLYAISKYVSVDYSYFSTDILKNKYLTKPLGVFAECEPDVRNNTLSDDISEQDFYESYAKLRPGDILATYFKHVRMVTGKTVVKRYDNGVINPYHSYVILIENKSAFTDMSDKNNYGDLISLLDYVVPFKRKEKYTDIINIKDMSDKKTNFRINRKVPFIFLSNMFNIPLSFRFYDNF